MSSNASNRNMLRLQPSRSTDKLSHIKSTSRKIETDRSAANKNVIKTRQDVTSQQNTSTMAPPSRLTKQVRNPIPIRHTLTSKLRMEKANPLLTSFVPDISEPAINGTPSRRSTFYPGMLQIKQKPEFRSNGLASESRPVLKKKAVGNERKIIGGIFKENKHPLSGVHNKVNTAKTVQSGSVISKPSQILAVNKSFPSSLIKNNISSSTQSRSSAAAANKNVRSMTNRSNPLSGNNVNKQVTNTSVKTKSLNNDKTKAMDSRKPDKSSSVASRVQTKKSNTPAPKKLKSILRKSASVGDLRKTSVKNEDTGILREIENRTEAKSLNKSLKSVAFYSPLHNATFTPVNITNTPTPGVLRKRLEDWLAKRGKSSFSCRHLCCFGLPRNASVIPTKLNCQRESSYIETVTPVRDGQNDVESCLNETITLEPSDCRMSHSLERGHETDIENSAPKDSSTPQETNNCDEDKENAALSHPEALDDLRKLVLLGYPRDQCDQWLSLISKSHPGVREIPQYWECLAALEEARGDFSSAVDCYGRAIVKGADANDVDERLDDLWEKFCALSVNSVENKRTPIKKLAIDTKQIFKSTVIKFALQQKAVKRSTGDVSMQNVNYIVTPVRRSSRRSTSRFRTTPTVKCVDKLEDFEQNIRETMEFHGNAVLNPGN